MSTFGPATVFVTGGAGSIGTNFIRFLLSQSEFDGRIVNVDKLTYAGNPMNLSDIDNRFGGSPYWLERAILPTALRWWPSSSATRLMRSFIWRLKATLTLHSRSRRVRPVKPSWGIHASGGCERCVALPRRRPPLSSREYRRGVRFARRHRVLHRGDALLAP